MILLQVLNAQMYQCIGSIKAWGEMDELLTFC